MDTFHFLYHSSSMMLQCLIFGGHWDSCYPLRDPRMLISIGLPHHISKDLKEEGHWNQRGHRRSAHSIPNIQCRNGGTILIPYTLLSYLLWITMSHVNFFDPNLPILDLSVDKVFLHSSRTFSNEMKRAHVIKIHFNNWKATYFKEREGSSLDVWRWDCGNKKLSSKEVQNFK